MTILPNKIDKIPEDDRRARAQQAALDCAGHMLGHPPLESLRLIIERCIDAALGAEEEPCGVCAGSGCPECGSYR